MKLRSPSNYAQIVEFFKRLGSLSGQDLTIIEPTHCYVNRLAIHKVSFYYAEKEIAQNLNIKKHFNY